MTSEEKPRRVGFFTGLFAVARGALHAVGEVLSIGGRFIAWATGRGPKPSKGAS